MSEIQKQKAPFAVAALVLGIFAILSGLFIIGLVLGILGLIYACKGLSAVNEDPNYCGRGMLIAGLICSIAGIIIGLAILVKSIVGWLFTDELWFGISDTLDIIRTFFEELFKIG